MCQDEFASLMQNLNGNRTLLCKKVDESSARQKISLCSNTKIARQLLAYGFPENYE